MLPAESAGLRPSKQQKCLSGRTLPPLLPPAPAAAAPNARPPHAPRQHRLTGAGPRTSYPPAAANRPTTLCPSFAGLPRGRPEIIFRAVARKTNFCSALHNAPHDRRISAPFLPDFGADPAFKPLSAPILAFFGSDLRNLVGDRARCPFSGDIWNAEVLISYDNRVTRGI